MATKNKADNTEKNDDELPSEVTAEAPLDDAIEVTDEAPANSAAELPSVQLESHYSFYDDAGAFFQWIEGQIETDIEKITMLIERKAPLIEVTQ